MLSMSGTEAMRTWVRMRGPGHCVHKSISMSPRHSSRSTARRALLAVRRIWLVMHRRAAGNNFVLDFQGEI
jgi:hypothetical protein